MKCALEKRVPGGNVEKNVCPFGGNFVFESQTTQNTDCYSWLGYGDKKCLCCLGAT
jgi:hypothetical protein